MQINSILIIGTGNAAWHIGKAIMQTDLRIEGVVARDAMKGRELAHALGEVPYYSFFNNLPLADAYLIAVRDDAISEVAQTLKRDGQLMLHCSGATPGNVLSVADNQYGVLWPMLSLQKHHDNLKDTFIAASGSTDAVQDAVYGLAHKLSEKALKVDDKQRQVMHMCAVWINNYTNHMYAISKKLMEENGLDFSLFYPGISAHVAKLKDTDPVAMQTGPARRGEMGTLERHHKLLTEHPDLQELYETLAQHILNTYLKK